MIQSILQGSNENIINSHNPNINLNTWTKEYVSKYAKTFFKKITYLNQDENVTLINAIKENMKDAFGNDFILVGDNYDNVYVCIDNVVVSCAVIDINKKFIFNLCTHSNYQKRGFAKILTNRIISKYRNINKHQLLSLDTETTEKGTFSTH